MDKFEELIKLQCKSGFICKGGNYRVVFAPDLGARVFCELNGVSLHRLDIDNIHKPTRPFNNYGGNNFWPAPEGGIYGFNYKGNEWYIQPAINREPFSLMSINRSSAKAFKGTVLENRNGTKIEVIMERIYSLSSPHPVLLKLKPFTTLAYTVDDRISVQNSVKTDDALLACWTLEQFEATNNTISFAKVSDPQNAINYDYYSHPGSRISYGNNGFFYKTDSKKRGQIGLKKNANTKFIGFYDLERKVVCIREIVKSTDGIYFNIADNEQPNGPFSAMDNYSVFNGDGRLGFFELETIGCAEIKNNYLKGSRLTSKTSFAIFDEKEPILQFIKDLQ